VLVGVLLRPSHADASESCPRTILGTITIR